jgi:ribosomal protein L11 methyltransferase
MSCLSLSFALGPPDAQFAEAACIEHGALSVTFSDARDDAVFEPLPGEIRLWSRTRLTALFAADRADAALLVSLAATLGIPPSALRAEALDDRPWEREWLRDFHAMRFGRRLWVCPHHEDVDAADAVVVRLDPGLAFGTGTHPSTAQCLAWLDGRALAGQDVIDYGCGSGVLAIAALKLGARRAVAFDIDPQALIAARENAENNGVAAGLQVRDRTQQLPRGCHVLLANILSETLLGLAPELALLVAPGGSLLLAGLLAGQEGAVASRYAAWFDMERYAQLDGWVALHGRRQ